MRPDTLRLLACPLLVHAGICCALLITPVLSTSEQDLPRVGRGRAKTVTVRARGAPRAVRPTQPVSTAGLAPPEGALHAALDALGSRASPIARPLVPRPATKPPSLDIIPEYSREALRARLKTNAIPIVERCYEEALTRNPRAGGKLVGKWRFNTAGRAIAFEAAPAYGDLDRELVRCVRVGLKAVTIFELHPATKELRVIYPFVLTPTVSARD